MSPYQVLLVVILFAWPLVLMGVLILMSKLEARIDRIPARTPEEAGLEPTSGSAPEKEVTIVFGGEVVSGKDKGASAAAE
jgi:hypothetical protein